MTQPAKCFAKEFSARDCFSQICVAALVALVPALSACGGGGGGGGGATSGSGSGATASPQPATPPANEFAGTARLKYISTRYYPEKSYGLGGQAFLAEVRNCNDVRAKEYGLGPVFPSEVSISKIDVSTVEKFFDTDKALTVFTNTAAASSGFLQWLRAGAGMPGSAPPDCSIVVLAEGKFGTLWRDGVRYDLRFEEKKAVGLRGPFRKLEITSPAVFNAFPLSSVLGESCRVVSGLPGTPPADKACVSDAFPHVKYMNWPFALSGRASDNPLAEGQVETITPLAADRGQPIDASVFNIPAGLVTTVID